MSVKVVVRFRGGAYVARAGRGKKATHASSTDRPVIAARRAAAKLFRLDPCNVQTEDDIEVTAGATPDTWVATLPERKGGAS